MPRDLIRQPEPEVEVKPDLSKPSLEALAYILRHPEEWPANYEWDYTTTGNDALNVSVIERRENPECGSAGCAIGVARLRWGWDAVKDAGIKLRVDLDDDAPENRIFNAQASEGRVTPAVVADRIDDYLAGRPIRFLVAGDRDR